MGRRLIGFSLPLFFGILLSGPIWGDEIHLKDGKVIMGDIANRQDIRMNPDKYETIVIFVNSSDSESTKMDYSTQAIEYILLIDGEKKDFVVFHEQRITENKSALVQEPNKKYGRRSIRNIGVDLIANVNIAGKYKSSIGDFSESEDAEKGLAVGFALSSRRYTPEFGAGFEYQLRRGVKSESGTYNFYQIYGLIRIISGERKKNSIRPYCGARSGWGFLSGDESFARTSGVYRADLSGGFYGGLEAGIIFEDAIYTGFLYTLNYGKRKFGVLDINVNVDVNLISFYLGIRI